MEMVPVRDTVLLGLAKIRKSWWFSAGGLRVRQALPEISIKLLSGGVIRPRINMILTLTHISESLRRVQENANNCQTD